MTRRSVIKLGALQTSFGVSAESNISDPVAATMSRSVLVSRARGKGSAGNVSGQRRTAAAVMVARCRQAGNRRRREW